MAQLLGRTQDKGWVPEQYYKNPVGRRFHDLSNTRERVALEFKAGEVGKSALDQLRKDSHALARGWVVEWYVAPGSKIDPRVQERLDKLQHRYPGKFSVIRVPESQFKEAIRIGKEKAKAQEQAKAVTKALDPARVVELAARKKELAKTIEEKTREIAKAQHEGKVLDLAHVEKAHSDTSKALDHVRAAERAQTAEMLKAIGLGPKAARDMSEILEQGRENQRAGLVASVEAIGKVAEQEAQARDEKGRALEEGTTRAREVEAKAQEARERAAEWQRNQMEQFQQKGMAREFIDIMQLVNQGRPAPGVPLPAAPEIAPEVTRDGRAKELERTRIRGIDGRGPRDGR
ncbi:hypothetical protein GZH49_17170 [Nocardia terpenica]|uniref:hypothetical protein n=1 Tax=Nocardia terpenica TaxID=455432 RepID=UPI002FDF60A8